MRFACLSSGDDKIGLSAQEGRDLDQIDNSSDLLGLFRRVDISSGGDAEFLFDGFEMLEPLLDPDPSFGFDGGSVGFIETRFEDIGKIERITHCFAVFSDGNPHFEGFEGAWTGNDGEGLVRADKNLVYSTGSVEFWVHRCRLGVRFEHRGDRVV